MALEDIGERLGGLGWLGAGLGVVLLAPAVVPALGRGLRPVAKGTLKGCMALTEKTREVLAETSERWQDLVAEARAEHERVVGGTSTAGGEPIASLAAAEERAEEPRPEPRHRRKSAEHAGEQPSRSGEEAPPAETSPESA